MSKSIDITIPVLNEELRLEKGVRTTVYFLDNNNIKDYIITIADNGSTDKTEIIANSLVNEYDGKVRYIKVPEKGVGLALKSVWPKSDKDIVGYMDVDLSTDIKHLLKVLELFENKNVEVVNGSRISKGSVVINRKLLRECTSRIYNFLVRTYFNGKARDYTCGFKFFKRDVALKLINQGIDEKGWFFVSEILIRAEKSNKNVFEIPVKWEDDPEGTTVRVGKLSLYYIKQIIKLKHKLRS